ncbi:DUF6998 domain-containing protein [Butyrivibrio sp. VCD2006]|uniref:DUF6998 domain-containing protein n=1 Tax=Butyrivibrio sp. VCD2006 TaxID=1280664 RepID=UPI0004230565|nr:hypothetical protein [Butyrivibrio sp. VCD2006]
MPYTDSDINEMLSIYRNMVKEVENLESKFENRHFTLDGHIIGSIGEVAAANYYGINLFTSSTKAIDGEVNSKPVQIKVVQQDNVMLSYDGEGDSPHYLLVLYLNKNGIFFEVYNGLWKDAFSAVSKSDSHGYKHIRVNRLLELDGKVSNEDRIQQINSVIKMRPEYKNSSIKSSAYYKKVFHWAQNYYDLFMDPASTEQQLIEDFPEKCEELGFFMDCGHTFESIYGKDTLNNKEAFHRALAVVEDPILLGSAIFSIWRYYTHWAYDTNITSDECREWFIMAFDKMKALTN